jgi:hypothetical protein
MLSAPRQAYLDRLDEQPERRGGGHIVSFKEIAEQRSRRQAAPLWLQAVERRRHQLAIFAHMIEREERRP